MNSSKRSKRSIDPNVYPPGLNRAKVEAIIAHYDAQQDNDLVGEFLKKGDVPVWVEVPTKLLPKVRRILEKYKKSA